MNKEKEIKYSKFISLILRHKPEIIGIKLDEHGWADVKELLDGINYIGRKIDFDDLVYIVDHDNKQRYSFNEDKTKIRANQGHSVKVDVELEEVKPPKVLYHGTSERFVDSIIDSGIKKMNRLYVHLSKSKSIAENIGSRHGGETYIFAVNCEEMVEDGYTFYLSKNDVYLVDEVPPKYLTLLSQNSDIIKERKQKQ